MAMLNCRSIRKAFRNLPCQMQIAEEPSIVTFNDNSLVSALTVCLHCVNGNLSGRNTVSLVPPIFRYAPLKINIAAYTGLTTH